MKARLIIAVSLFLMVGVAGCGAFRFLLGTLGPSTVGVELINNSDFDVRVRLYYDDEQDTIEAILTETGVFIERTLPPGGTHSFVRDCDDLQAIIIDDADLRIIGGVGPADSTDVLRDGSDFRCGDTLVFTFDHSNVIVDFRVEFEAVPPPTVE